MPCKWLRLRNTKPFSNNNAFIPFIRNQGLHATQHSTWQHAQLKPKIPWCIIVPLIAKSSKWKRFFSRIKDIIIARGLMGLRQFRLALGCCGGNHQNKHLSNLRVTFPSSLRSSHHSFLHHSFFYHSFLHSFLHHSFLASNNIRFLADIAIALIIGWLSLLLDLDRICSHSR